MSMIVNSTDGGRTQIECECASPVIASSGVDGSVG